MFRTTYARDTSTVSEPTGQPVGTRYEEWLHECEARVARR